MKGAIPTKKAPSTLACLSHKVCNTFSAHACRMLLHVVTAQNYLPAMQHVQHFLGAYQSHACYGSSNWKLTLCDCMAMHILSLVACTRQGMCHQRSIARRFRVHVQVGGGCLQRVICELFIMCIASSEDLQAGP